jgi:uncharacterized membrane protein YfcA
MGLGAWALYAVGGSKSSKDLMGLIIGVLILIMLVVHFLHRVLGERLSPRSKVGIASTGASAGFATTVSNAAGPIMQIYMTAHGMPKEQFMGTIAWYFFIINVSKVPVFAGITALNPSKPMFTPHTLMVDLMVLPMIVVGVFVGKWMLPRIPQKAFDIIVLILSACYAVKLIVG